MPKARRVKRRPPKRKVKKKKKPSGFSSKHIIIIGAALYMIPLIAALLDKNFSEELFLKKTLETLASLALFVSIYIALKVEISRYYKKLLASKLLLSKAPTVTGVSEQVAETPAVVRPTAAVTPMRPEAPVTITPSLGKEEEKTEAPLTSKKTCPYCGGDLPLGDIHIFCPHCGRKLRD